MMNALHGVRTDRPLRYSPVVSNYEALRLLALYLAATGR